MNLKRIIKDSIKKNIRCFILILCLAAVNAILTITLSKLTLLIVDDFIPNHQIAQMCKFVVLYFICAGIQAFISYETVVLSTKAETKLTIVLKSVMVRIFFNKTGVFFSSTLNGERLQTIIGDSGAVSTFFTNIVIQIATNAFVAACMIGYLAYLQWDLLIIVLILQPLVLIVQVFFNKLIYSCAEAHRDATGKEISFIQQFIENSLQFSVMGLSRFVLARLYQAEEKVYDSTISSTRVSSGASSCAQLVSVLNFAVILGLAGYKIAKGSMTIGMLLIFIQYSQNLMEPILKLFNIRIEWQGTKPSYKRIAKIINSGEIEANGHERPEITGNVNFEHVSFGYDDGKQVIHDFSAQLFPGSIYCVTGPSGVGKSTLCSLLMGLWPVNDGTITVNGEALERIEQQYYYDHITYIAQVPFVLSSTIRDNVCLGSDFSDEQIYEALRFSSVYEDVMQLPDGLDYYVGNNGQNLSVGQKQRICLARAYLRNSPLTIFDEPTASIGHDNAEVFVRQLEQFKKDKVVILLTHDEYVAGHCDWKIDLNSNGAYSITKYDPSPI